MTRTVTPITLLGLALLFSTSVVADGGPCAPPERARLKAHVATLTSPEFAGRRGAGGLKAAGFLVAEFQKLGLEPGFAESFEQAIPGKAPGQVLGRNVAAALRGSDPSLRDEWVIVAAHYDHLGVRGGRLYPGADDNASGVAMMLEVARGLAAGPTAPRRSVLFVGFDLEEAALYGSRHFASHSPVPLDRVALFVTADMIGRSLGGVCEPYVFVMGSEHAPGVRGWLAEAAEGNPVTLGILGSDVLVIDRSDYGPFRSRRVPYLFFSTGENPTYHTPLDVPETLNYPKLEAISRVIFGVVRRAAAADRVPGWVSPADNPLAEAETIRAVLVTLLAHRESLEIGSFQATLMGNTVRSLDAILARGTITPEERLGVVRVARVVLFSLF